MISLGIVSGVIFALLSIWIVVRILKERCNIEETDELREIILKKQRKTGLYTKLTLVCNILISLLCLGFSFHEYWKLKTISIDSLFKALSWLIASFYALYFKRRISEEERRWPLVLILWWLYSSIVTFVTVSTFLFTHWNSKCLFHDILQAHLEDLISLPVSIFSCFNYARDVQEIEQPLLHENSKEKLVDSFSNAGFFSQLTFSWLNPLFEKGRDQKLEYTHVPPVPKSDTAETSFSLLEESIRSRTSEALSLRKAIIYSIWKPLAMNAVFAGINTLAAYMGPLLVTNFVIFLSGKEDNSSRTYGFCLAFLFFFAKTVESLSQRQWYFGANRIGIRVRAALMVSIYKETLKIKSFCPSSGMIVNVINVDVERTGEFFLFIHGIWLLPVQVFLALVILYRNLGPAPSIAAILATVLVMVGNTPLARIQQKLHSKIMEAKDARIKATSETLKSMRVLKLHSWEVAFLKNIMKLRGVERNWLKKYLYLCAAIAFLFWTSPSVVSITTFGVCILVKTPLTSAAVLTALATFRILQDPINNLPELISMISQTKVSLDRIQEFIREEGQQNLQHSTYATETSDISIEIKSGEYTWETSNSDLNKPTIKITENINILKGSKIAVCGTVGSGKSSFLCSILGEIPRVSGLGIEVFGSKAYVPQSAWIQTGSVRENVLFGKELDNDLYKDILISCALDRDIEMWADGDWSMIGERGINLSGGQKQRIQLARALYSESDVYLLDDPFSAVDAHTGAHLFKECLMRVLSEKTVVYVTHQLQFLDASDLVLVIKDGEMVQSGKYEDLITDPYGELVKQMAAHSQSLSQVTPHQEYKILPGCPEQMNQIELKEENYDKKDGEIMMSDNNNEEATETGRVKWRVYSIFVTSAYKGFLVPFTLLCHILFQGLQIGSNYWIAWATKETWKVSDNTLIGVFVLLSVGSSLFILGRAILLSTIALETSQRLFHTMINSVFRAPTSFFDNTPSSQILNRCSTDQSTVDTDIPYRVAGLAFALIQLFSVILLMSHVAWQILLLFVVVIVISAWYQNYYIHTARELARMKGTRLAPILHHFSESISGASTIRCFNQETRFHTKNQTLVDGYSGITLYNSATMEWLCVRINFLFNLVFLFMLIILVTLPKETIDPSMAGLAATYGLNLHVLQAWVIWNLCNVENKMISVERILQFSNLPSEAPLEIEESKPGLEWPTSGTIDIENLYVRYSPSLPMILKGITCRFPGMKKIGVVGRTGSGKSTLIQALFRVVEPSDGKILIDGVDIGKMGLHDLRSSLSIIPQDPTLFQGTVRTNLDPLMQHADTDIWKVLNKCHLGVIVQQDQRLLDAPVAEDGENWSVGQRQLVCLARVMLNKRKILVLDEATASVDTATDNVIQKTIREETSECTVITVAHRIPTVIDNDLVLVLDDGKIVEFDSPTELLKDGSSAFSKLVKEFLK